MKEKLRLDVDALRVDTFVAQERPTTRGTVNGHDDDDDVNYSTLPACSAAAGCETGAAACVSGNPSCQTGCLTTPCCAYTQTCPPSYTCP